MPVEEEKIPAWAGFWSARWCSTPHPRFMLCGAFPISYVHNKPLFRGLSVATRGELSNAFRLSQAYGYIIPHI